MFYRNVQEFLPRICTHPPDFPACAVCVQDKKTEHYKRIVDSAAEARPGVLALMDEGLDRPDIAVCICSAATKEGFVKVVNSVVKPERLAR